MIIHTVEAGDTVYKIAKQYNTTPTKILEDNELSSPDQLVVGQTLVILFPTKTYTVRQGDTAEGIAAAFGISMRTLWQNNPALGGETTLYPGQILSISYPSQPYSPRTVNGYALPSIRTDILRRTLPYLTYLTIFASRVTGEGEVIPPDDDLLIAEARKYGVAPILLVSNLSEKGTFSPMLADDFFNSPTSRIRMTKELVSLVQRKNYAGIEFDFEYIPQKHAETYANMIENVRRILCAEGRCVFVSVAPKQSESTRGLLYDGHQYDTLGEAANGVRLMTYEWGHTYGEPMPVAPLPEVQSSILYAKTKIPAEKLTMGIPSYGYDWALPYVQGKTRATTLFVEKAVERALKKNAAIAYNEDTKTPYYTYYEKESSPAVQHIVHFEDGNSIKAKLELACELGLSGVSIWNLMDYCPQYWLILHYLFESVRAFPCGCQSKK